MAKQNAVRVDVRLIAATNRSPDEAVRDGHLRADLYHRLNVVGIEIPPLRDWLEDLPLLVAHSVAEINREQGKLADGPDPECLAALKSYSWPGNVRQLRNVLERAVVTRESGAITLQDLPDENVNGRHDSGKFNAPVGLTLQSVVQGYIKMTLESVGNGRALPICSGCLGASFMSCSAKTAYQPKGKRPN